MTRLLPIDDCKRCEHFVEQYWKKNNEVIKYSTACSHPDFDGALSNISDGYQGDTSIPYWCPLEKVKDERHNTQV